MAIFLPDDDETENDEDVVDEESTVVLPKKQKPKLSVPPLRCRVAEAAEALRVSERLLAYRISNGELPTVRDGGGRYVLVSELRKYAKKDRPLPPPKTSRKRVRDGEDGAC